MIPFKFDYTKQINNDNKATKVIADLCGISVVNLADKEFLVKNPLVAICKDDFTKALNYLKDHYLKPNFDLSDHLIELRINNLSENKELVNLYGDLMGLQFMFSFDEEFYGNKCYNHIESDL